jgi:hypothetical protein
MPDLTTKIRVVKRFRPCRSTETVKILREAIGKFTNDTEISLSQILTLFGVEAAFWFLRCFRYSEYRPLLDDVAESILPVFETKHPNDKRPREAILGAKDELGRLMNGDTAWTAARAAENTAIRVINGTWPAAKAAKAANIRKKQQVKHKKLLIKFIKS